MKFIGIDDNLSDLAPLFPVLEKYGIERVTTNDASIFMAEMAQSSRSDIVLSDGMMEEVIVSLDGKSRPSHVDAETAGYSLLVKGYEGVGAKALTRIILSIHDLKAGVLNQIKRLKKKGDVIEYISKVDDKYLDKFEEIVRIHVITNNAEILKNKLVYVSSIINDWTDDEEIKLGFIGETATLETFENLVSGILSLNKDTGDRCDAIYRIKVNLSNVYGENGLEKEKSWLNRPSEYLENRSPFDLIRTGHQHELYRILSVLEQH